ncbi:MAG: hypothetical protein JM58_16270 [Peptococcaceae bacterium BICA1-8]|nr:MAG: hypothetical protein JM58_16270 [Peptococcaceae bacterium BICA1-8]
MNETFMGYRRPNGSVGIRNHVVVLSAMDNVNGVVKKISSQVKDVLPITILYGRGQFGQDNDLTINTLIGMGKNPNIASVLVVSLEKVSAKKIADGIAQSKKPVAYLSVQDCGGSLEAAYQGSKIALEMVLQASEQQREECLFSELILGVECGGSDTTSGIASNPAVGYVADKVVDSGGVVFLSETSEFMGAEHVLAERASSPDVAKKIWAAVKRIEDDAKSRGVDIRGANPVPDNIAGGLTTIEEKSLGAIMKGGTAVIQDLLEYGQAPTGKGLYLMDTPAPASESMTALVAGGAQVILFSTGKGNIMGNPIAPTIKISGNPKTVKTMIANIDLDVTGITEGTENLSQGGDKILEELIKVCSGKKTKAEVLGEEQIAISRIQPTV